MKASRKAAKIPSSVCVAFVAGVVCCAGGNPRAGTTPTQESVETILSTLEYTERLIQNIRIKAELDDWSAAGAAAGLPPDEDRHVREYASFVFDNDGRMRYELEIHEYTPSGALEWDRHRHVMTYNRTCAMTLDEFEGREPHRTLRSASIANLDERGWAGRTPLDYCGGLGQNISQRIRRALENNDPMELTREEGEAGERYVLTTSGDRSRAGYTYKFWLDPKKLFYATRVECYYNGRLIKRVSSIPKLIAPDTWVPESGEWLDYRGDAENPVDGRTLMMVKEVEVNKEVLPDSLFEIRLLPGTKVGDTRSGVPISYYVGVDPVAEALLNKIVDEIRKSEFTPESQRIAYDTLRGKDGLPIQLSTLEPNLAVSPVFSAVAGPTGQGERSASNRVGVFALLAAILVVLVAIFGYRHRFTSRTR